MPLLRRDFEDAPHFFLIELCGTLHLNGKWVCRSFFPRGRVVQVVCAGRSVWEEYKMAVRNRRITIEDDNGLPLGIAFLMLLFWLCNGC